MPIEKKTANCQHCGNEFTQARKDQKYCKAECRFEHFFEKRDNEKALMEERIAALQKENDELKAQLQAVPAKPRRERLKAPAS